MIFSTFPTAFSRFMTLCVGLIFGMLLAACGGGGSGTVGLPTGTALFTNAPGSVAVAAGAKADYTIGGGTPTYTAASSNRDVATATVLGTALSITGVGAGGATITVTDAAGAATAIGVTVSAPPVQSPSALFSTAAGALTVPVGGNASYAIGGGRAPYAISSSNTSVASAMINGSNFTVSGLGSGAARIVITDAAGIALDLAVTVGTGSATPLYSTAPSAITVKVGANSSYAIGGGRPGYSVSSSNPGVAQIGKNGNDFVVTGVAAGSAQIAIVDAGGASISVDVTVGTAGTVTPLFSTAPDSVTMAVGTSAGYTVSGGTGTYSATTGNAAVATVSLSGGSLTVNAIAAGITTIRISDSAGASDSIVMTVMLSSPSTLVVNPNAATGNVGDTLNFLVSGGMPGYTVTINNTTVATVAPSSVPTNGGGFSLTLRNVGTTTATITDAQGQVTSLPITANQTTTTLRLSPSALIIGENYAGPVTLNIFGGTGPYTVFTSDESKSQVSVTGSVVTVNGVGPNGTRCIRPVNSEGTYVPFGTYDVIITTVDSQGASATNIITIKDNGDAIADASCV